jgi:hypothetical protein
VRVVVFEAIHRLRRAEVVADEGVGVGRGAGVDGGAARGDEAAGGDERPHEQAAEEIAGDGITDLRIRKSVPYSKPTTPLVSVCISA